MLNTRSLVLLMVIGGIGLWGLSSAPTAPAVASSPIQELAPPSELALLMRSMAAHADSVKARLARGADLPKKPKEFKNILTATPTTGMHIDPITFPTFGKDYQSKLDRLYKAPRAERTQAYNALIQSCANCHGSHCPGPLMRIKNMYVTTPE